MARALQRDDVRFMSAASLLETTMVIESRRGDVGAESLDSLIRKSEIEIVPFTARQAEYARRAFRHYGRGNHPAKLNFGDCISYAVAKEMGEPLLFKGEDFEKTDIEKVDWQTCAHKDN